MIIVTAASQSMLTYYIINPSSLKVIVTLHPDYLPYLTSTDRYNTIILAK